MSTNGQMSPEVRAALEAALAKARELGYDVDVDKRGKPSDGQLARRWIDQNPDCRHGLGEMRRYRDGHWPAMDAEEFRQSVLTLLQDAESEGVRLTDRLLRSVIHLIETEIALPPRRWDADPDIIVCANGTLDLKTFALREHSPDDYATSALGYAYAPGMRAPVWERVLADSLPDDAIGFLQEFAGYALTASTEHEIAVWLYGPPASGKSTVAEGFQAMLGPRAGVLSLAEIEQSRFALGDIAGRTLLVATEQPALYMRASYRLNALISGEPLVIERKFMNPTTIRPVAKLLWAMNELPRADASSGLFRRVRVIPCRPVAQPDPTVKAQVKQERAGILNWALEGLRRLRERGQFEIPPSVQEASRLFQQACDIPAQFLTERCERGDEYRTTGAALYSAYRQWCADNGHQPMSATTISEHWVRLGLVRYRAGGTTFYRGVQLRT